MSKRDHDETMLEAAFRLAHFIVPDRQAALRVAVEALAKVEVAAAAQNKRLYYTPTGRPVSEAASGKRSKVAFGEAHLLQRLVFVESEPYERDRERGRGVPLDEDAMTIHFIKHLARITTRRNSFYVALGFTRVLHVYTTPESMEFYGAVVQDPDRVPDDYYYRSRKKVLLGELRARFGETVRVVKGQRGEARFEPSAHSERLSSLVDVCLARFAPWGTRCPVARPSEVADGIASLAFTGTDPDEEHRVEVRRIHAVMHPDCHRSLAAGLGLPAPSERRDVPRFYIAGATGDSSGGGRGTEGLTDDERRGALETLAGRGARRKYASSGQLSVRVDGAERASLEPSRAASVSFEMSGDEELLEVASLSAEGDTLLAVHLLDWAELDGPGARSFAIVLEAGQEVAFVLEPSFDALGDLDRVGVTVRYAETAPWRAFSLGARRLLARAGWPELYGRPSGRALGAALAVLIAVAAPFGAYMLMNDVDGKPVAKTPPEPPPANPPAATEPTTATPSESPQIAHERPRPAPRPAPTRAPSLPGPSDVRSTKGPQWVAAQLSTTKTISVDPLGDDTVRAALLEAISTSGRFSAGASREEADAVIKGSVKQLDGGRVAVTLRLVNADGDTIWPASSGRWKFTGGAAAAGHEAIRAIVAAAAK